MTSTTHPLRLCLGALALSACPLFAQVGMVADDVANAVFVFNSNTDTVLGTVAIPNGPGIGDCAITKDQKLGFVTNFNRRVYVVDLTKSPPALATGTNPILVANPGEDLAISKDGKYLLVCDGSAIAPLAVVDIATRTQVHTWSTGRDCNSVEVCGDGTVLATSFGLNAMAHLSLNANGTIAPVLGVLGVPRPMNTACPRTGSAAVATSFMILGGLRSFKTGPLALVHTRNLPSNGVAVAVSPNGNAVFARSTNHLTAFSFNSTTGALGATASWSRPLPTIRSFFGMDQVHVHPTGNKVYTPSGNTVRIYSPAGALLKSLTHASMRQPTGICIAPVFNRPPDCSKAVASTTMLWPPNHKFIPITIKGVTDPDGDPVTITIKRITQDETVIDSLGVGAGATSPDATGVGTATASLRAERYGNVSANGNGRVYDVEFVASDGKGGVCPGSVRVCVPHSMKPEPICIDDGVRFPSTQQ